MAESDILLKDQLDTLAAEHPLRFKVHYVLNNPPEGWKGGVGFVSQEMIKTHLPGPAPDMKMLLCGEFSIMRKEERADDVEGPPPMLTAMKTHLTGLGFEKANTISKMPDQVSMLVVSRVKADSSARYSHSRLERMEECRWSNAML